MTERENILAKIKKMLTLARRATNENEAAQAASVAHKFMERYNLCITEVEGTEAGDSLHGSLALLHTFLGSSIVGF